MRLSGGGRDWKDPGDNGTMAQQIYAAAGNSFKPWTTYNTGAYLAFMPAARGATVTETKGANSVLGIGGAGAVGDAIGKTLNPFGDVIGLAGKALTALTSGEFWKRAGVGALGVVLLLAGLIFLLSQSKVGKVATNVATKGVV